MTDGDYSQVPWRVGRSVGRTIYAVVDPDADKQVLIGMMDTRELAADAVESHNFLLTFEDPAQRRVRAQHRCPECGFRNPDHHVKCGSYVG